MERMVRLVAIRGVVTSLVVLLMAVSVWLGLVVDLNKSEWASWVQAVGSIAAIVAAFIVARVQGENDRKLSREAVRGRWAATKGVIDPLVQQCLDLEGMFDLSSDGFSWFWAPALFSDRLFDAALARCHQIPLFDLESEALVRLVIDIQLASEDLLRCVKEAKSLAEGAECEPEYPSQLKSHANEIIDNIRLCYSGMVAITGGSPIQAPRPFGRFSAPEARPTSVADD